MTFSLLFLLNFQAKAYTVSTNTTWSNSYPTFSDITVENGATLTITGAGTNISVIGDIDVKPGCELIVENQATVKMGSSIILENGSANTNGAVLETNNNVTFTALNTTWNGIQVWGTPFYGINGAASALLTEATIENAIIGVATYKEMGALEVNRGGIIQANFCTFQANKTIGVDLVQNPQYLAQSINGPIISVPANSSSYFKFCNFYFQNPNFALGDIGLKVTDAKGVSILGCIFKNEINNDQTTTGIRALNAEVRVAPASVSASWGGYCCLIYTQPCKFINLGAGLENWGPKVFNRLLSMQALFQNCQYSIETSGSQQSIFTQNGITDMGQWGNDPYGIILEGSSGYTVESNNIESTMIPPYSVGIAVWDCGSDDNEIFKNTLSNVNLGIEVRGCNRNLDGLTGLELLCNDLHVDSNTNKTGIFVFSDFPSIPAPEGLAQYQGVIIPNSPSGYTKIAAGNLFAPSTGFTNYYRIDLTQDVLPITYGYSNASPYENPVNVTPNVNVELVSPNGCPTIASKPSISYTSFLTDIAQVESQINGYQQVAQSSSVSPFSLSQTDSIRLAGLWRTHQKMIDSMLVTYMYLDSTAVHYDSMAMALEAVHLGYFNKIKLAGIYLTQLRYDDAINLLNSIPGSYSLTTDEATDVSNMKDMYVVIDTLVHNGHNWDTLPNTVKQNVTNVANGNGAYGTPVARYLLARYEGIYYYPNDSLLSKTVHFADNKPNPGALFQAQQRSEKNKIYPNPATNQLMVNWSSQGKSTLKLFDVFGKQVFKAAIHQGETTLNIGQLASGIYTATISQKGHSVYQQKIIKK